MDTIAALLFGYVLGCVVPGYYLVRWRARRDIRTLGSGKVGATNVGRVLGGRWVIATLAADICKGVLAVGLARGLGVDAPALGAVGCAVVAGHVRPAQLGFRGGRGAATAFGAALVVAPAAALGGLIVAALAAKPLGSRTTAGILGIAAAPVVALAAGGLASALAVGAMAALVLAAHRDHIGTRRTATNQAADPAPVAGWPSARTVDGGER